MCALPSRECFYLKLLKWYQNILQVWSPKSTEVNLCCLKVFPISNTLLHHMEGTVQLNMFITTKHLVRMVIDAVRTSNSFLICSVIRRNGCQLQIVFDTGLFLLGNHPVYNF